MRSFLTEAINLSYLRNPLYTAIKQAIVDTIKQLAKTKYSDDLVEDYRRVITDCRRVMQEKLCEGIVAVAGESVSKDTTVKFEKLVENGKTVNVDIFLRIGYVHDLTEQLINAIAQQAQQARSGWNQAFAAYSWEKTDRELVPIIRDLIGVIIHELVHVKQVVEQRKAGRIKKEYRSYVETDKQKFDQVMNAIRTGKYTDADYVAYRASPQEIAAFAHQIASMFLDDHPNPTHQDITRNIDRYVDRVFDKSDKKQKLASNRLHKMIYTELANYVEHNK